MAIREYRTRGQHMHCDNQAAALALALPRTIRMELEE
jgi:hypothetical protein